MLILVGILIFTPVSFQMSQDGGLSFNGNVQPSKYIRFDNSAYKYHQDPRMFADAMRICEAEGGHLAVLNSEEEVQFILSIVKRLPRAVLNSASYYDYIFVGFHDAIRNGDYVNIHGQSLENWGYSLWNPGEPSGNNDESCGSIHIDGGLADTRCDNRLPYVCEMPLNGCSTRNVLATDETLRSMNGRSDEYDSQETTETPRWFSIFRTNPVRNE